jgi:hypothetical protein
MPTRTIRLQSPNDNANVTGISLVPVDTPSEHEGLRCDVRLYPKLKTLHCASMRLTGLTGYDVLTELEEVKCQDNQLAGGLWPLLENIKLKHFWCHSNFLGGSIPDLIANAELQTFYCHGNRFTGFAGFAVSDTLGDFQAQNNLLSAAAVDKILNAFATASRSSGTRVLNLGGAGNAAPTSAGLADKDALVELGWTVTTN